MTPLDPEELLAPTDVREPATRMAADDLVPTIQRLSAARELPAVMAIVPSAARQLTGADGATFVLRDGDFCVYADEDAISPLWKGQRFPMHTCISGWVMRTGTPAIIEDIDADSRIPAEAYRRTFVKSLVVVAVGRPAPVAAIGAYWATRRRPTEDEVAVLQTIADSTALALDNVQLYETLEEARAANRAKDEFLATLSHELRTPLNAIYGWVKMLRNGMLDDGSRHRALEIIERNAISQIQLINDLLDISRIVTGGMTLNLDVVDLPQLTKVALDSIGPAAEAKGIVITSAVADNVPPIRGDEHRLQQVIWNLVSNAVKFTPSPGRVDVRIEGAGAHVRLTVTDTGPGIDGELLPHVFERFRQGDSSVTRAHGGLGLGLALVRHFVELHGGTVAVVGGGVGKGATFTVDLPLQASARAARSGGPPARPKSF